MKFTSKNRCTWFDNSSHKAEHLEERRLMLQWWADFLGANREQCISPFEYAKINNPLK
ncbi:integrase [Klebsiella pneumoniae]|nr:integrase [Klebsiella pneumoniae]